MFEHVNKEIKTEENPFLNGLKIEMLKYRNTSQRTDVKKLHDNNGIVLDWEDVTQVNLIDRQRSCSIYRSPFADEMYFSLCNPAKAVFFYIIFHLQHNKDKIELKPDHVGKVTGMSRTSAFRAINELIDYHIIAKAKRQSTYWVNPYFIFSGNRKAYFAKNPKVQIEIIEI